MFLDTNDIISELSSDKVFIQSYLDTINPDFAY